MRAAAPRSHTHTPPQCCSRLTLSVAATETATARAVTGVASAIGLCSGVVFGRLSDVHGRRAMLLLAVAMFTFAPLLLGPPAAARS